MTKTLIVAEKRSVADDYASALGEKFSPGEGYLESDRYVVSWAVGHLVGLAEPEEYDEKLKRWTIASLPIVPDSFRLEPDPKGRKQLAVLGRLMKREDVREIVNGCDAGREGELIFAYIAEHVGVRKPVKRLWVSSMTRDAIRSGFARLRDGAELRPLEDAARSRSEADWLVGMNATRAATVRARALGGVVSMGRVQTPTLALIVQRDAEIDAFRPETFFHVEGRFLLAGEGARRYRSRWFSGTEERIVDRERAEGIARVATGATSQVASVKRTERREQAPLLYDLTSLQREANRFGLTAARTLAAAQRLYEGSSAGALITYPRTRSRFLPGDQIPRLKGIASSLAVAPAYRTAAQYVAGLAKLPLGRVVNDARVDDHHAIIPTGDAPTRTLSGDDARVYDLVVRRFLAVFHPEARWEDTEIVTEVAGETFRTRGRRLVEAGWRAVYDEVPAESGATEGNEENGEEDENAILPRVSADERGRCELAEAQEKQTRPPAHYSEASILSAMESAGRTIDDAELREAMKDSGLGTPATRAETIEKLVRVGYVERVGRTLRATAKGRQAIGLLGENPLVSAELTGDWERRLIQIERGREQRANFMSEIRAFTGEVVEHFRGITATDVRAQRATVGPCPNGDGEIRENSRAYGCSSWKSAEEPGCGFVIWKAIKGRPISPGEARTLIENGQTDLLDGFRTNPRRGRLVLIDGAVQLHDEKGNRLDIPAAERETIATCPKCGGEIKENSRAYGCSSWKSQEETGCGFVIWKSTSGHNVTHEEARAVIAAGRSPELTFKDRRSTFAGYLVLTEEREVNVERSDGKEMPAPSRRRVPRARRDDGNATDSGSGAASAPTRRRAAARTTQTSRRSPSTSATTSAVLDTVPTIVRRRALPPPSEGEDLLSLVAAASLEVVDRRGSGGALWVIGGQELTDLMADLGRRGHRFLFAPEGSRSTKRRPAWWCR